MLRECKVHHYDLHFFHLADSFHDMASFNITYSTTDFSDNYISVIPLYLRGIRFV